MRSLWESKLTAARTLAAWAMVALVSACGGGGGGAGESVFPGGGGSSAKVTELSVVFDKSNVPNDGSQVVTATVTALDANRVAVKNVPITFAVDNGGVVQPAGTATDDKGELKATVAIGDNKTNRTITLTAGAGGITKTANFSVVDSTTTAPTASALSLLLDKRTVNNSGTDAVTVTVTATGEGGRVVAGIPVSFTVDNNATYEPSGAVTDASGVWTAKIKIGDDKANRLINVTAKSGQLSKTDRFQVTGVKLAPTALPSTIEPGRPGKIEYRVTDINGSAIRNIAVNVAASGMPSAVGTTDDNGLYVHDYTAPSVSGTLTFSATAAGVSAAQNVVIIGGATTIPPANKTVASATLNATPSVLKVNTPTTNNQSQIKALFLAADNTAIPNVRVRFSFVGTPNGSLSAANALVYSDAQGNAVTSYKAGLLQSPTDGVVLRACWDYADFAEGACPNVIAADATLTVVAEGLAVTIGTDDTIEEGSTGLTYLKRFVVQVADTAGNPVGSQQVTPAVDLTDYYKGDYRWNGTAWIEGREPPFPRLGVLSCPNEDRNRNGTADPSDDVNHNGVLEPRKSDVTISMVNGDKTDASGQVVLKIEYPKSHANWVGIQISASADVRSPPASWSGRLPLEATALKRETPPPAFVTSPYKAGVSGSCTVAD